MSSVALITSQYALTSPVDADRDLAPIVAALQRRGVDCRVIDWLDESARYDDLDLAVIKSPWDYAAQAERFVTWLAALERVVPVANHPELIRWNLDKAYLGELTERASGLVRPFTAVPLMRYGRR